jgi:hypothetical protein
MPKSQRPTASNVIDLGTYRSNHNKTGRPSGTQVIFDEDVMAEVIGDAMEEPLFEYERLSEEDNTEDQLKRMFGGEDAPYLPDEDSFEGAPDRLGEVEEDGLPDLSWEDQNDRLKRMFRDTWRPPRGGPGS